jgi:hypothetical protein
MDAIMEDVPSFRIDSGWIVKRIRSNDGEATEPISEMRTGHSRSAPILSIARENVCEFLVNSRVFGMLAGTGRYGEKTVPRVLYRPGNEQRSGFADNAQAQAQTVRGADGYGKVE